MKKLILILAAGMICGTTQAQNQSARASQPQQTTTTPAPARAATPQTTQPAAAPARTTAAMASGTPAVNSASRSQTTPATKPDVTKMKASQTSATQKKK